MPFRLKIAQAEATIKLENAVSILKEAELSRKQLATAIAAAEQETREKAAALERALTAEAKLSKLEQHAGDALRVRGLAFRKIAQLQNEAEAARAAAAAAELRLAERLAHLSELQQQAEAASRDSEVRAADAEERLRAAERLLSERSAAADSHRERAERLEMQLERFQAQVSAGTTAMAAMEEVLTSEVRSRSVTLLPHSP